MSTHFDLSKIIEKAKLGEPSKDTAHLAIRLLDLTSLEDDDSIETVEKLCEESITPAGSVATVCVFPRFVDTAVNNLQTHATRVAAVIGYPDGTNDIQAITNTTLDTINAGASEVEILMDYKSLIQGNEKKTRKALRACRQYCTGHVKMKVIVESGAYSSDELLNRACIVAMEEGADFIKTSTGKISTGATLEASAVILRAIRRFNIQTDNHHNVGFKAAGGIKTTVQAAQYMELAKLIMGDNWISPETFRFGASKLRDDLLRTLGMLEDILEDDDTKTAE